ncbi:MAG: tRNA (guanosine(37)-N1)-methyltransferase TrmD, partial [Oscillospiraceae bacterium]|nr:tRNA (guanosine(37)-N1)-methyltransferase TrmD [Oscillospiraceae bacterium]
MRIDILTLFPGMCETVLNESIIGRARQAGKIELNCHHIRDYSVRKGGYIDDTIFGHGKGMLIQAEPVFRAVAAISAMAGSKPRVIHMSPKGKVLTQRKVEELAKEDRLLLICGHYEGIDQRALDEVADEEISAGDYVLTGGELPALMLADAVARLKEGVLSDPSCWQEESHAEGGLLEAPHYTKPSEWRGKKVPEVLLGGDHEAIERWRREQALLVTLKNRPELLEKADLRPRDRLFL